MASVSISHLIIFIASLVIAGTVVGVAFTGVDQFNNAMEDRSVTAAEQLRTDITVISDPGSDAIYDESEGVIVLVKNTGNINLRADPAQINVLFNGRYVTSDHVELNVLESDEYRWRTSQVLELTILPSYFDDGLEDGDHRVTITVNGDEEVLLFRVDGGES